MRRLLIRIAFILAPYNDFLRFDERIAIELEIFEILPIFVATTPNQEHQSRLLVAKMVAKDLRPTNFLRGKRLKIGVKILSPK
uniref:hypothetical protein n=1 Tax=Alistipes megaguti TaxID=2364787 RepID=UPI000EFCA4F0|nr:hypothetical protein [Alistipes megaguti]